MKSNNLKTVLTLLVVSLFFTSCEESEAIDNEIAIISEDNTIALVESEDISDEIDNIVDDFLAEEFNVSGKDEAAKDESSNKGYRPACLVKTIVLNAGNKTVTLDFGEGCESHNGHVLAGKIIMSYAFDRAIKTVTVTKTFEGFSFNNVAVEGENIIVRVKKNENGNPQSTKTINVTYTWSDGVEAIKKGTKVREFIEGSETRNWGDNVFLITGDWTLTFKDGTVFSSTIVESLKRKMACRFLVSGSIEVDKAKRVGTLNFGDGTCDNKAIFTTADGTEKEITLRKRKK